MWSQCVGMNLWPLIHCSLSAFPCIVNSPPCVLPCVLLCVLPLPSHFLILHSPSCPPCHTSSAQQRSHYIHQPTILDLSPFKSWLCAARPHLSGQTLCLPVIPSPPCIEWQWNWRLFRVYPSAICANGYVPSCLCPDWSTWILDTSHSQDGHSTYLVQTAIVPQWP